MTKLEQYYNKFNEEKRLLSRHGQVEYAVSMKYIKKYLDLYAEETGKTVEKIKILEVGAGTGRYCVALAEEGYDVTGVELVNYNLGILKKKGSNVKAYQGNAVRLKRFEDACFDMTLVLGPMYHLFGEDKLKALLEAKRVTKKGGYILTAYCMNDYSILTYGFKEGHIRECIEEGTVDNAFHVSGSEENLYDYVRLSDIDRLNAQAGLKRVQIIAPDGAADYMRPVLNAMDEETFRLFIEYQMSVCERQELVGASSHTLDILKRL